MLNFIKQEMQQLKNQRENLLFLDTDDWWHRDKIKNQIKLIKIIRKLKFYIQNFIYMIKDLKKKD